MRTLKEIEDEIDQNVPLGNIGKCHLTHGVLSERLFGANGLHNYHFLLNGFSSYEFATHDSTTVPV